MEKIGKVTKPNWYDSSCFISKWLFSWLIPLHNIGYVREITFDDLCRCCHDDEPIRVADKLEREWNKELQKRDNNKSFGNKYKPNLMKAIFRAYWIQLLLYMQITVWGELILRLSQPFMVGIIVRYLSQIGKNSISNPNESIHSNISESMNQTITEEKEYISNEKAIYTATLLIVTSFIFAFSRHPAMIIVLRLTVNIRTALTVMIYRKILKISKSSLGQTDIGQILNILANDLNRFEELGWHIPYILVAPPMSAIVIYVSYLYLGVACVGGLVLLILFIPFQGIMGRLFSRFRRKTTAITDIRVRVMGEIISAMKLIKLYCWEGPFASNVNEIRKKEVIAIRRTAYLICINIATYFIATRMMLFSSFIVYVLLGNPLDAETVFVMMSLFNSIRVPVTNFFPQAIGSLAESLVSCDRVEQILLYEERQERKQVTQLPKGTVSFSHFRGKWSKTLQQDNLKELTLQIDPGQLVIVIGTVGAGKTCLLHSVLNEIETTGGQLELSGHTSYAPQESWCFSGSIRENILLGASFDQDRYQTVVRACGLEQDMTLFPNGDQTFVGEKGYSLSGGQKARVTLARAVYNRADVYLLDDPLSAVDPKVSNHIFDQCIKKYLKDKTVILVTHQLQFLTKADKIVVMNDGAAIAIGTYDQLINSSIDFLSFLDTEEKEEKKETLTKKMSESGNEGINHGQSFRSQRSVSVSICDPVIEDTGAGMSREEESLSGGISAHVYWDYLRSGASIWLLLMIFAFALSAEGLFHFTDLWLADWTSQFTNVSTGEQIIIQDQSNNAIIYTILVTVLFVATFLRMSIVQYLCLRSSINLHNMVFNRVLRAPMLFFENNPLGRILNRLTKDIGVIDQVIPRTVVELQMNLINVVGTVAVSIIVEPYLAIPCICLGLLAIPVRTYYIRTTRTLQRLDALARSPVYSHISATFDGLTTVRAFGLQGMFTDQFVVFMNDSVACRWLVLCAGRLVALILDGFVTVYTTAICIVLVATPSGTIPGGQGGLILSSSLILIGLFQWCVRQTAEFETQMVSTERVLEYGKLDQEARLRTENHSSNNWPEEGKITFEHVTLRYSPDLPPVLKDISFSISPGEKVGIVGRTGAGKSSLISVLFRLVEPDGTIQIDGIDTKILGLHDLRERISIIPQDPTLFSGTIRKNLDPFGVYSDDKLWDVLKSANLDTTVNSMVGKLDSLVTEGGKNLSVGQRQLLCLSRALLKNNRILILDEATANVDHETDDIIQRTIKTGFDDCTILTIAHRLNTVIDMDRILVMDMGQIVEFDSPHRLLQNDRGQFHSMVSQTGQHFESILHKMAEISFENEKLRHQKKLTVKVN